MRTQDWRARVGSGAWALPLRVIVGYGFMAHGYAKYTRGAAAFAGVLHGLGVPLPDLMAPLTIAIEWLGGLAILAGAFVTAASVPLVVVMIVAAATVHAPYGFSSVKLTAVENGVAHFGPPGYEVALLYVACLAALVAGGPGPLSVDRWRAKRK